MKWWKIWWRGQTICWNIKNHYFLNIPTGIEKVLNIGKALWQITIIDKP